MVRSLFTKIGHRLSPKAWAAGFWAHINRSIQRATRREYARLADPAHARSLGRKDMYCRLAEWLPPPAPGVRVLELGCGPGKYVSLLSGLGYEVVGADPIPFPEWDGLRQRPGVTLQDQVFAEELPYPDQSFDHVVCLGTLLYVRDPAQSLREMRRVIKPGGRLVVRTVNRLNGVSRRTGKPVDPASKHLFDMDELTAAVEAAGFRVTDRYAYGWLSPYFPVLYWYAVCVWLPFWLQDSLSNRTRPGYRWNNILLATAP